MSFSINSMPGFVDLQVNGFLGVDYSAEGLTLEKVLMTAREIYKRGTAGFLATVITSSEAIYEKNVCEKLPMASTTKIMTALVVLENMDLESQFFLPAHSIW